MPSGDSPAFGTNTTTDRSKRSLTARAVIAMTIGLVVAGILVWQGITAAGNPIPTADMPLPMAALDVAILVSREGLESTLVLATLVVGLRGKNHDYQRPIGAGAGVGFVAVMATWFGAIALVSDLSVSYSALELQALMGFIAVVVILVEMDWFFHGVYWSGWISMQNREKRSLIAEAGQLGRNTRRVLLGLAVLGFVSVYREGFEVVLFLQSFYLEMGPTVVYYGAAAGLALTAAIAYVTFLGQRHLPYKNMLVATGVLLTGVVFVMVGEEVNQMQLAGWIGTTTIPWLSGVPAWAQSWFSIFPNVQTIAAQSIALLTVAGSFFFLRYRMWKVLQSSKNVVAKEGPKLVKVPAIAATAKPDSLTEGTITGRSSTDAEN
jgi:high-affinity iron transporter